MEKTAILMKRKILFGKENDSFLYLINSDSKLINIS